MDPNWEVSVREVARRLEEDPDSLVLIDCRRPEEWQTCRIEGALLFPMEDIPARLRELEEHEDRPVVVYCHTGRRSLSVAAFLKEQGFEDVRSMSGGIEAWSLEVDPSVPRY